MTGDDANFEGSQERSIPFRIGICLLNLIQPGLGFVRISRFRAAFAVIGASVLTFAGLVAFYAFADELSASWFMGAVGTALAILLLTYVASIALTWRWSKTLAAHPHWLAQWYGIVGLWALLQAMLWPAQDLARSFYHPYYAPSESMAPAIEQTDRFVAHMRDYGPLKRGDVVIVRTRNGQEWVKRVAAIPGDRIAMRGGQVLLNGTIITQRKVGSETRSRAGASPEMVTRLQEQFPGEVRPHEVLDTGSFEWDDTDEIALGTDQYFLLGDNRDNSVDSRQGDLLDGLGVVKREQITGRALFRYWRSNLGLASAPL